MQRHQLRSVSRAPGSGFLHRLPDAVVTFDLEWRYAFLNRQAEINHQCRPGELLGRCVWDVFPEGRELETYRRYMRAIETQAEDIFDEYLPMFGRWYEQRLFPAPHALTVVARDITDWRELNEERAQLASRLAALEAEAGRDEARGDVPLAIVREPATAPSEDEERAVRIIVTVFPKPGRRNELIALFQSGAALLEAVAASGALSSELQVPDDPSGPLVLTVLCESAAQYVRWTTHPQRRSVLDEVVPLAEEVCIERYEVVRLATAARDRES
ncbi:MAG: hypothetical protein FJ148_10810 [Deltaproteobacteria bacterium]|nr:hypothetical protein [Deltaproteobacteria bacterium]